MSVSLPSREVFSLNVPVVKSFDASFKYNFFTPDEQLTEVSPEARKYASRPAEDFDSSFVQVALSRVPRSVVISFSHPTLVQADDAVTQVDMRAHTSQRSVKSARLIRDNFDKIVTEDHMTFQGFVGVNFHDGEIDSKVYEFVSGSYLQRTLDENVATDTSHHRASLALSSHTPSEVKPFFLSKAMNMPRRYGRKTTPTKTSQQMPKKTSRRLDRRQAGDQADAFFDDLKDFSIHAQLNSRMIQGLVERSIKDPNSSQASDMQALYVNAKMVQRAAVKRFVPGVSSEEFKTVVPFVQLTAQRVSHPQRSTAEIVGYVIDKFEIVDNGQIKNHNPIIVENGRASSTLDVRIRYGARYGYVIKTIVRLTLPVVDAVTNELSTAHVLVASRPSKTAYVHCHEDIPPSYPSDFGFTWDYEREKLTIRWSFPTTSQRDVKKFQLFRRLTIEDPFELIKEYDFDDSLTPTLNAEQPSPATVERLKNPAAFYVDDEFDKSKKFIYAVGSVDAHGLVSSYSAQFEVSFDVFKNKLVKRLVSHGGAPKPYPNMYIDGELFSETIRDKGHQRMKVYFNPEFYQMYDGSGRVTQAIATNRTGGSYVLSLINVDVQKQRFLTMTIDDRTKRTP